MGFESKPLIGERQNFIARLKKSMADFLNFENFSIHIQGFLNWRR
jgi:hypothetical protein